MEEVILALFPFLFPAVIPIPIPIVILQEWIEKLISLVQGLL
jgi:hypothetical protein